MFYRYIFPNPLSPPNQENDLCFIAGFINIVHKLEKVRQGKIEGSGDIRTLNKSDHENVNIQRM